MNFQRLVFCAGFGSLILLVSAFLFQYLGGFHPCEMCYWQRYPHLFAIILAIIILVTKLYWLAFLGVLATVSTASIGAYHAGVEIGWWKGPRSCTAGSIDNLNIDQLLNQIMSAPVVRCDEVPWQMLGLSMASWNMLLSIALAFLWAFAVKKNWPDFGKV